MHARYFVVNKYTNETIGIFYKFESAKNFVWEHDNMFAIIENIKTGKRVNVWVNNHGRNRGRGVWY